MGSCRTWGPGWGQGLQAPGLHTAPPDSGWATGWSQAASPARGEPVSRVTATQQGIVASPAPATRAGREQCVTSKLTIPVMATSKCVLCLYSMSMCWWLGDYSYWHEFKTKVSARFLGSKEGFSWEICISVHIFIFSVSPSSILRCIHGTCLPINSYSYSCRCQPGFAGVLCDEQDQDAANPCSLSRCKHGKCRVSGLGKAYCECNSGYTGEACDRGEILMYCMLCVSVY